MNKEKKTIYTLSVNDKRPGEPFDPEMEALTFPLMARYAEKIQADFVIIRDRKFPDLPPVFEKFQIYDLGRENKSDWHIFLDGDTLVNPDCPDFTVLLNKDTTCSHGSDFSPMRWRPDEYFRRDGRFIGKGNWCAIASDWCLDYWHPVDDVPIEQLFDIIYPINVELNTVIKRDHLIDDLVVSRNIARFGLKHVLIPNLCASYGITFFDSQPAPQPTMPLFHQYTVRPEQKIEMMKQQLKIWGVKP